MDPVTAFGVAGDALGIVDFILSLCKTIYKMADNAKANRKRCQQIAERVKALDDLVRTIKRRGRSRISSTVNKALKELCRSLEDAEALVMRFSKTTAFGGFVSSGSLKEKFLEMDKRLSDNLHVLSGALLIEQGNVLHEVYKTVKGRKHSARSTSPASLWSVESPASASFPRATSPGGCIMPPMQTYRPMTATTVGCFMPASGLMRLPEAVTPYTVTTTTVSRKAQVPHDVITSLIGQASVARINTPMTFSTQNLF